MDRLPEIVVIRNGDRYINVGPLILLNCAPRDIQEGKGIADAKTRSGSNRCLTRRSRLTLLPQAEPSCSRSSGARKSG